MPSMMAEAVRPRARVHADWSSINIAALARFFSASVIRDLAQSENPKLAKQVVKECDLRSFVSANLSTRSFFERSYEILAEKNNRNEYVYKNTIANNVLLGTHSLNTACMLTELRVGNNKADAVILNGTSMVFEVKSERDSLARLAGQVSAYREMFDHIVVVCGENHVTSLEQMLAPEVGIYCLSRNDSIRKHRKPSSNVANVIPSQIFESLRRSEYLAILKTHGVEVPEVPTYEIHTVSKNLFSSLSPQQAHDGMVKAFKSRYSDNLKDFIQAVPNSLKSAAISIPLTRVERERFLRLLDEKVGTVLKF